MAQRDSSSRSEPRPFPEPAGVDPARFLRQDIPQQLGYSTTSWPEFVRSPAEDDAAAEDAASRHQALSAYLDSGDLQSEATDPDTGPAVRERRPGGGEARRQFDEDPVEDLRSSRGGPPRRFRTRALRTAWTSGRSCELRPLTTPLRAGSGVRSRRSWTARQRSKPSGKASSPVSRRRSTSRRFVAAPAIPPSGWTAPNAPNPRQIHLGYRLSRRMLLHTTCLTRRRAPLSSTLVSFRTANRRSAPLAATSVSCLLPTRFAGRSRPMRRVRTASRNRGSMSLLPAEVLIRPRSRS